MSQGGEVVTGMVCALVCVAIVWWLMWRGWRDRVAQQEGGVGAAPGLTEPADALVDDEDDLVDPLPGGIEGIYASTVSAGRKTDRIAAHGLGTRSAVRVGVVREAPGGPGLVLLRTGARSFTVPAADLVGVRRTRGQAGKFSIEKEGLVVITWRLGGVELDTGVRTRRRADRDLLVSVVQGLVGTRTAEGAQ